MASSDLNDPKEQFSYSYVCAVATVAGYICGPATRLEDGLGVDMTIRKFSRVRKRTRSALDVQIKCTSVDSTLVNVNNETIKYDLDVDNYIELIKDDENTIPQILVLMLVPPLLEEWISQSHENLIMRKCAYYETFRSHHDTTNKSRIRIPIPKTQIFSPSALKSIIG